MLRKKIWILAALVLLALPAGAQEATPKPRYQPTANSRVPSRLGSGL